MRYTLKVVPHGSIYIGGYSYNTGISDGDTAKDEKGFLIPGSVMKGALREAAVRLVKGSDQQEEGAAVLRKVFGEPHDDPAAHDVCGILRVGALRARELPDRGSLRHHVSLERATRHASPGRLFQNFVTPAGHEAEFVGEIEWLEEPGADEQGLLEAAVQITDQIGGGRGRGLGLVRLEMTSSEKAEEKTSPDVELRDGEAVVLELEVLEPLRLGDVKDRTNVLTTKDVMDGSAVRGAIAAVLTRQFPDEVEPVLAGAEPAVFGNARPRSPSTIPAPLTLLAPKRGDWGEVPPIDIAVDLCADSYDGRNFDRKPAKCLVEKQDDRWNKVKTRRRMVSRSARNHLNGRSHDGLLYTLQTLDPLQPGKDGAVERLRFFAPVSGTAEQQRAVIAAAGEGLLVGGVRTRGYGRVRLAGVTSGLPWGTLEERHRVWVEQVREAISKLPEDKKKEAPPPESTGVVLALGPVVLDSCALHKALAGYGLEATNGRTRRTAHGGWNSRASLPRLLCGSFMPGSVWIVRKSDGQDALNVLEKLERNGLGPGRADGWGHVVVCHPIHLDCLDNSKEKNS